MQKRILMLLVLSLVLLIANGFLVKHTGYASVDSTQGTINLVINAQSPWCGNRICSSGETCSNCPADCGACAVEITPGGGGGGGSGGAITHVERDFSVDRPVIKVMVRHEESFKTSVKIKNTEEIQQSFFISLSPSLEEMVFASEDSFYLGPGEERMVDLTFVSTEDMEPAVYTGNLEIKTAYNTKQVPIVFSVKSKMILFDISLDIPVKYKEILPGEEIFLQLTLFNLGEVGKTDVSIEYLIKDFEGEIIIEESETLAVETQASFSKTIKLPSNIKPGDYVAIVQVRYDASLGSSSVMFHVMEKESPFSFLRNKSAILIIVGLVVLIVLIFLILEYERKKFGGVIKKKSVQLIKVSKKIEKKKKAERKIGGFRIRLKNKLVALRGARDEGHISTKAYKKGERRLRKFLDRI